MVMEGHQEWLMGDGGIQMENQRIFQGDIY